MSSYAHGCQPLLDAGRRKLSPEALDPSGDVHGPDVGQAKAALVARVEEFSYRAVVSAGGVRVPDVRGKEFDDWLVIGQVLAANSAAAPNTLCAWARTWCWPRPERVSSSRVSRS